MINVDQNLINRVNNEMGINVAVKLPDGSWSRLYSEKRNVKTISDDCDIGKYENDSIDRYSKWYKKTRKVRSIEQSFKFTNEVKLHVDGCVASKKRKMKERL